MGTQNPAGDPQDNSGELDSLAAEPCGVDLTQRATVSLTHACVVLGIHRSTGWELYRRGEFPLPVLKVGHRLLVAKVHLARFLLDGGTRVEGSSA